MDCKELARGLRKVSAALRSLPPEEAARVDDHLSACVACRDEIDALRMRIGLLARLPRDAPPTDDLLPPSSEPSAPRLPSALEAQLLSIPDGGHIGLPSWVHGTLEAFVASGITGTGARSGSASRAGMIRTAPAARGGAARWTPGPSGRRLVASAGGLLTALVIAICLSELTSRHEPAGLAFRHEPAGLAFRPGQETAGTDAPGLIAKGSSAPGASQRLDMDLVVARPDEGVRRLEKVSIGPGVLGVRLSAGDWFKPVLRSPAGELGAGPWYTAVVAVERSGVPRVLSSSQRAVELERIPDFADLFTLPFASRLDDGTGRPPRSPLRLIVVLSSSRIDEARLIAAARSPAGPDGVTPGALFTGPDSAVPAVREASLLVEVY